MAIFICITSCEKINTGSAREESRLLEVHEAVLLEAVHSSYTSMLKEKSTQSSKIFSSSLSRAVLSGAAKNLPGYFYSVASKNVLLQDFDISDPLGWKNALKKNKHRIILNDEGNLLSLIKLEEDSDNREYMIVIDSLVFNSLYEGSKESLSYENIGKIVIGNMP